VAGISEKNLRRRSGWPAGIDNQHQPHELTINDNGNAQAALLQAENVDLATGAGKPHRRKGYTLQHAGTRMHSLWKAPSMSFALFVENGTLRALDPDGSVFDVQAGLEPRKRVSYEIIGDRIFWSNGVRKGAVLVDGTPAPWGCPNPAGQPQLVAADGSLAQGTYQVAITYTLATGEESGTGLAATIDLPNGGGITLAKIPQPASTDVTGVRVYLSPADGETLKRSIDVPVGLQTAYIGGGRHGRPLDTQFLEPMPPGRYICLHTGRLFVLQADGTLVWSEPLRYGLHHPRDSRLRLSGSGDLLASVGQGTAGAGLFVASGNRTYFLSGDPSQFSPRIVYPYGAVPGTLARMPGSVFGMQDAEEVAYWMASNGIGVIGVPGGGVLPLREKQTVAPTATTGASMFRQHDGLHQVVTTLAGGGQARGLAIQDVAKVTVIRHDQ